MTNQKVYNINAMRPAIVKMREKGNRGVITAKLCSELGISETYYTWYKKTRLTRSLRPKRLVYI